MKVNKKCILTVQFLVLYKKIDLET